MMNPIACSSPSGLQPARERLDPFVPSLAVALLGRAPLSGLVLLEHPRPDLRKDAVFDCLLAGVTLGLFVSSLLCVAHHGTLSFASFISLRAFALGSLNSETMGSTSSARRPSS